MAANSKIEWTEATWNFLAGCSLLSPGCQRCYAMRMAHRLEAMATTDIENGKDPGGKAKYIGTTRKGAKGPIWTGKINFDEKMLLDPLKRKKPTVYFVNSESDLFHEDVPDEWIDKAFAVMGMTPQHTYQVLTKRPERMAAYLEMVSTEKDMQRWANAACEISGSPCAAGLFDEADWPLANVWLGTSIENRECLHRLDTLQKVPAAVRFLSLEPLLESLGSIDLDGIGWVIVGGESQSGARPMHPQWAREVRNQCIGFGVPFFFKQWGEWAEGEVIPGGDLRRDMERGVADFVRPYGPPDGHFRRGDVLMRRVGKKAAGRQLDGREWNEFPAIPEVTHA